MQTRLRHGITNLATKVAREFIASEHGSERLKGYPATYGELSSLIGKCRTDHDSLGDLTSADIWNIVDIAKSQLELISRTVFHIPSQDVLCQHFAAISAEPAPRDEADRRRAEHERIVSEIMLLDGRNSPEFNERYISYLVDQRVAEIERKRQAKEVKAHEGYRNMGPVTDDDIREQIGLPRAAGPGLIRRMFRALRRTSATGQRPSRPSLSEA